MPIWGFEKGPINPPMKSYSLPKSPSILNLHEHEKLFQERFSQQEFTDSAHHSIEAALGGLSETYEFLFQLFCSWGKYSDPLQKTTDELAVIFRSSDFKQYVAEKLAEQYKTFHPEPE